VKRRFCGVLREAESRDTVAEIFWEHGVSQQAIYLWKKM